MVNSYALILAIASLGRASPVRRQSTGGWDAAYAKSEAALAQLMQDEKVGIVTGVGWQNGPCVGNTSPVPKIGYPSLCLQDGPLGIRFAQGVTAFPAGVHVASTWDKNLLHERGVAMGAEAKGLGVNVQLGPAAGALGKIPEAGRNWEGFSPDPYLAGIAMQETIIGMQSSGVQACAKHYIANEQELNRNTISSNVDDRTMHELYLWPFADAVNADVASVMCSYNKLDGAWACENDHILNSLLKDELAFRGYVMSDWNAQHSTALSANSGLDMTMPGDDFSGGSIYWGPNLAAAVAAGEVPQERLDDMVKRILAAWYLTGQDTGYPPVLFSSWNGGAGGPDVQADHKDVARAIARDGIVLLKNEASTLPLNDDNAPASLAIIGQSAIVNPAGPNACEDRACNTGHLAMGWGSGTAQFPYLVAPLDAIQPRAEAAGTTLTLSTTDDQASAASAAAAAETAIVFITADSGEEYLTVEGNAGDRVNLDPWHDGNGLVAAAASAGKPVIVVANSVGPLILENILSHENVVALVWAGIAGQESGNGLADVLYGDASPSGKLPYTIAKAAGDYETQIVTALEDGFEEGLYIDYRHFDKADIEPRYEFGFGLSYTNFTYSDLLVGGSGSSDGPSATADLYAPIATVTATITNSGDVGGAEVAQLYLSLPISTGVDVPVRQLRGFEKIDLAAGESGSVDFIIRRKDASYWDVASQQWVLPTGEYTVTVGASSRDLRLEGSLTI
ncbi:Beta-d-glucoside glucohydrolase protein [Lasiodiplodia theobromae]|uniref:Beta-d-glucoside glucohydrolase protein n=1 Tax=Lasiodiplodia theobromae TaxID=45133 RepID=UPI0015C32736|nr:Beta-d-glucoside glucohydrolase protein [Lasiodiplodia theobromae]KAF4543146.1 Beta-d-glucoside glucohydrolase protein [Lasiodiplodia theobromae]